MCIRNSLKFLIAICWLRVCVHSRVRCSELSSALLCADFDYDDIGVYDENVKNIEIGRGYEEGLYSRRAFILDDYEDNSEENTSHGQFLRIVHPQWCLGPHHCGVQMKPKIKKVDSATLSYRLRVPNDFDFRRGGKLPGLCSGHCHTGCIKVSGYDGWSVRFMWHALGELSLYIYNPFKANECGDNLETGVSLQRGFWHDIELHITLNDVSDASETEEEQVESNGHLKVRVNGEEVLTVDDFVFRREAVSSIDTLLFSNFFGGNDSTWKPRVDTYMDFDSLLVLNDSHSLLRQWWFILVLTICALVIILIIGSFIVRLSKNWGLHSRQHKRKHSDVGL